MTTHYIEQLGLEKGGRTMSEFLIHPRACGKSQLQENLKKYSDQLKQIRAQKNYLDLADKPKPYSIRIRRQRVKA